MQCLRGRTALRHTARKLSEAAGQGTLSDEVTSYEDLAAVPKILLFSPKGSVHSMAQQQLGSLEPCVQHVQAALALAVGAALGIFSSYSSSVTYCALSRPVQQLRLSRSLSFSLTGAPEVGGLMSKRPSCRLKPAGMGESSV